MVINPPGTIGRVLGIVRAEALRPTSNGYEVIYGVSEHEGKGSTAENIAGVLKYLASYTEQLQSEGFTDARVTYEDVRSGCAMTVISEHKIAPATEVKT